MYVFTDSTLRYLLKKIKSKIALKSELDNKVDKVNGKGLSDNDFTNAAKQSLENKYTSVEASYSTGMTHIKFSNEDQSNTKTIDLKTGCDMFFYPSIDAELLADLEGNVTIPYAFISKSGSDIGEVTVNIRNLTNNTSSENVFNVTDNGGELILEGTSSGNANVSFTIEGDTDGLKANVLGNYSTVIMLPLTVYRSTNSSLVPSNVSNPKTVVSDFGNGEYEIMLYATTSTNYLNFSNVQTLTNVSYVSNDITHMNNTYRGCYNLTGSPVCGPNVTDMCGAYYGCNNLTGSPVCGDKVTRMDNAYNNCTKLTGLPVCGPNVTRMDYAYWNCYSLTGSPVCGPNVTNIAQAYFNCKNLTGSPVCGPNVEHFGTAYIHCSNLTGPPVCGDKVTIMGGTYDNCWNLTGSPVCGPNVEEFRGAYVNCYKLTGSPVCGSNVISMYETYRNCCNLTGAPACGPNVTNMANTYTNCYNLTGSPVCGDNVTNMHGTYYDCTNLTGNPVCGDNVTNMCRAYYHCTKLTGSPVCGNNVTHMGTAYYNCTKLTGSPVCGDNVTTMANTYQYCSSLTGSPACGPNVTNMSSAYTSCRSLTGSPVCGPNVTTMANTYQFCRSLTGSPVCGDKVTNMANTYEGCIKLTGSPVCGPNVINMSSAYRSCSSLTGSPVCGNKVTNMSFAYAYCDNLTGPPVCGPNVTRLWNAYSDCYNLSSNGYFFSNIVTNARDCFRVRNTSKRLNLYVHANSTTLTTCLNTSAATSLTGTNITWTNDTANNRHYNTDQNIYIYPVANVKQAYKENELFLAKYTMNSGANVIPKVDSTTIITMEDITNSDGIVTRSVYLDESQAGKLPSSISFNGATNLLTVEKLKIDNITDTSYMFNGCSNLTRVYATDWDTSKITKADYMFAGCSKLTKESFVKEIKSTVQLQSNNPNVPAHLQLDSIDDFSMVEYYDYFDTPVYTLDDLTKNGDSYEIYFGGAAGTFSIDTTGHITVVASEQSGASITVTVHYNKAKTFELPNVESASHIFDGCTNLL